MVEVLVQGRDYLRGYSVSLMATEEGGVNVKSWPSQRGGGGMTCVTETLLLHTAGQWCELGANVGLLVCNSVLSS